MRLRYPREPRPQARHQDPVRLGAGLWHEVRRQAGWRPRRRSDVIYWDLTATENTEFNDPDWTVGIKLGRDRSRGFWVLDMRQRANPCDVERLLLDTSSLKR